MDENDLAILQDSFREVLCAQCPTDRVLRHIDGDDLAEPLSRTFVELGWTALTASEKIGGLGLGAQAAAILYRELGRALSPAPLMPTLITIEALESFGAGASTTAFLERLVSGASRATLMLPSARPFRLSRSPEGIALSGTTEQLLEVKGADLALVIGQTDEGELARVLVDLPNDGVSTELIKTADATRSLGRMTLDGLTLPAARMIRDPGVEWAIKRHGMLALAADAAGGAENILEITVDYLKVREQFGRPIGSFQALKHRCADHKMSLVAGEALLQDALEAWARSSGEAIEFFAAKVANCDAYAALAQDAVQLHGGIGFTWEHACHLFLKRAKLNQVLFGNTAWHLDHIAQQLAA